MSAEIIQFVPRDYDPRRYPARAAKPIAPEPSADFVWLVDALFGPVPPVDTAPSEMNPQEPA